MELAAPTAGVIRALISTVQSDNDPRSSAGRVVEMVRAGQISNASVSDVLAALQTALASDAALAGLIPQQHSEATIRAYLSDLVSRLKV